MTLSQSQHEGIHAQAPVSRVAKKPGETRWSFIRQPGCRRRRGQPFYRLLSR